MPRSLPPFNAPLPRGRHRATEAARVASQIRAVEMLNEAAELRKKLTDVIEDAQDDMCVPIGSSRRERIGRWASPRIGGIETITPREEYL